MRKTKLNKADIAHIKKLQKEGGSTADYLIEALNRMGYDVPAELHSGYNPKPPLESFIKFLKDANIEPDSDMGIFFKQKWDASKDYVKQYDPDGSIDAYITEGRGASAPDTLNIPRGSAESFYGGTEFPEGVNWGKIWEKLNQPAETENVPKKKEESDAGLLKKVKGYFGY